MNPFYRAPRYRSSIHVLHCAVVGILIGLGSYPLSPISAVAQQQADCASDDPKSEKFLACVRRLIEVVEKTTPIAQAVLAPPLAEHLKRLAETQGHRGAVDDLDALKRRSNELKRDPVSNRLAIAALDTAIASHADEISAALSTRALAETSRPGADIYAQFIEQKLAFLNSDKAKFYDRGPFDIARRSLLGSSLESEYFLTGATDKSKLRETIRIIDEILDRLTRAEYSYLHLPNQSQKSSINSNEFWRASLLFALGENSKAIEVLQTLARNNRHFGLETKDAGHVYVYRAFNLPHRIIVRRGPDGASKAEIDDPYLINRYYNPAQLALYMCAHLDQAGQNGTEGFTASVKSLVLSDYYVMAASADSSTKLQQFDAAVGKVIQSERFAKQRGQLLTSVAEKEMDGFSKDIVKGAQRCGIDDATRKDIFSEFQLRSKLMRIEGLRRSLETHSSEYLVFGGRINASQASAVSEFLNKQIFQAPEIRALRESLGIDANAQVARMRIDR